MSSALLSAEELYSLLGKVKILDASYGQPLFTQGIPGAVDFDIDDVADANAPLLHTIPSPDVFEEKVSALGISNKDMVVVYDRAGIHMAAARAWWMFRLFGHENIKILNGGLPAWMKAGLPVSEKETLPDPEIFHAKFRPELLKLADDIKMNMSSGAFVLLDARDTKRFEIGHIPTSLNTPYMSLIDPATGRLKAPEDLKKELAAADLEKPVACTCGSGVTACVIALALHELGYPSAAVYDGSWTEWGSDPTLSKETGVSS